MRDADQRRRQTENHASHDRPSQRFLLPSREPLARVAPHVLVPEIDETAERDMLEARATEMPGLGLRHDPDFLSGSGDTAAVVDVFKPCREELLVERADLVEHAAAKDERRAGRLIDDLRTAEIQIAIAIGRGDRISRK